MARQCRRPLSRAQDTEMSDATSQHRWPGTEEVENMLLLDVAPLSLGALGSLSAGRAG